MLGGVAVVHAIDQHEALTWSAERWGDIDEAYVLRTSVATVKVPP